MGSGTAPGIPRFAHPFPSRVAPPTSSSVTPRSTLIRLREAAPTSRSRSTIANAAKGSVAEAIPVMRASNVANTIHCQSLRARDGSLPVSWAVRIATDNLLVERTGEAPRVGLS